ncbi:hypothetical protein F5B20DRAFT_592159 [Whalleya microplaca]|nr:hypothetical protein F5B20DRAFT_592159 [Whalleya microplaca]
MNIEFDTGPTANLLVSNELCFQSASAPCESTALSNDLFCRLPDDNQRVTESYSRMSPSGTTLQKLSLHMSLDNNATITSPVDEVFPSNTGDGICSCITQAINTYELIEMNLVWSSRDMAGTTHETLQNQKKALAQCEELLGCPRCCARSEYVTLVMSMCDRIMGSLENTYVGIESVGKSTIFAEDALSKINHGTADMNHQAVLHIGRWQLDDDDELRVRQSLLTPRMDKLGSMISRLEMTINANYWPVHEGMIRHLRERYTEASLFTKNMFSPEYEAIDK